MENLIKFDDVNNKIITIRNQNVILDSAVAELYGVGTKEVNQAIRNNPSKFPEGYVVQLDQAEWSNLKSKFLTSSWGGKNKLPNVFTEKGLYMLAIFNHKADYGVRIQRKKFINKTTSYQQFIYENRDFSVYIGERCSFGNKIIN